MKLKFTNTNHLDDGWTLMDGNKGDGAWHFFCGRVSVCGEFFKGVGQFDVSLRCHMLPVCARCAVIRLLGGQI